MTVLASAAGGVSLTSQVVIALVSAGGGAVLLTVIRMLQPAERAKLNSERERLDADREALLAEASKNAVETVNVALADLREQLERSHRERDELRREVDAIRETAEQERVAQQLLRHELKTHIADLEKKTDISVVLRGLIEIKDEQRGQREMMAELLSTQGTLLAELLQTLRQAHITIDTGGTP